MGGGRWEQSGPWTSTVVQLLPSNYPPLTPVHSPTHAWDLKISKRCFSRWLTFVPPSSPEALFWIPGVGLVYGELGTLSGKGVGEQRSPVLDPLHPKLPPTRAQLGKTKTLCRDVHQRQKGEKSNHREEVFCTLCWFWGSVGKRRKPGQGRVPPPPPAGKRLIINMILPTMQCEIMHKFQRNSSNGQFDCFHYVR